MIIGVNNNCGSLIYFTGKFRKINKSCCSRTDNSKFANRNISGSQHLSICDCRNPDNKHLWAINVFCKNSKTAKLVK